jgi:hypothetical protein
MSDLDGLLGDLAAQLKEQDGPGEAPKAQSLANQVADAVMGLYDLHCTPEGEPYAVAKPGIGEPRIAIRLGARGGALRAVVQRQMYRVMGKVVSASALDAGLGVVIAEALDSDGRHPLHLRAAQGAGQLVLDLGNPQDARCVVITAAGWAVRDEPPAGVFFDRRRTTLPLPLPEPGGTFDLLRKVLGFEEAHTDWKLIQGWLVAAMFPKIPRPMLLLLGAAGSAKTSRAKALVDTLDPRKELGSSFGKSLDDDRVMAVSRYLVAWDNVSRMSADVSDHLCRLVTGDSSEKRALWSDDDQHVMSYRRTGIMTAISLPQMKPDALERVVPIHLQRMGDEDRVSETIIEERLLEAHPQALGALCTAVVQVLRNLPAILAHDPAGPRMKDYWMTIGAFDPECAAAYAASVETVLQDAAQDDPFVQSVLAWLRGCENYFWTGYMQTAYELVGTMRLMLPSGAGHDGWWPQSSSQFSRALALQQRPLEKLGVQLLLGQRTKYGALLTIGPINSPLWSQTPVKRFPGVGAV